ncbi:hypothetical protein ACTQYZ_04785 [Anaerofustis sp. LCP19S3_F7]|uniref:hypothetical protein n=1 Tax=Anaerofustis sp. LCP19S3_F7 TaxID=3440247 RepID=UPI003F8E2452
MLTINVEGVTLDLAGKEISGSDSFTGSGNSAHLIDITANNVSVKNGSLVAGEKNNHTLNVWNAQNVALSDLTLNGANATLGGAPLIVGASNVTVDGSFKLITGNTSWYAVNVDSRSIGGSFVEGHLSFVAGSNVTFEGTNPAGIVVENSAKTDVTVSFVEDVTLQSDIEDFVPLAIYPTVGEDEKANVTFENPENAGLVQDSDGNYVIHEHEYSNEWKNDETNHWKECNGCDEKTEFAAHTYKWVIDKEATTTEKGSKHQECTVCGYKLAAVEIPVISDSTGSGDVDDNTNANETLSPKTSDENNIVLWVAILCVGLVGFGGTVIYNKKRSL